MLIILTHSNSCIIFLLLSASYHSACSILQCVFDVVISFFPSVFGQESRFSKDYDGTVKPTGSTVPESLPIILLNYWQNSTSAESLFQKLFFTLYNTDTAGSCHCLSIFFMSPLPTQLSTKHTCSRLCFVLT